MARDYHLGRVDPSVKAAAEEVGERFGYTTIYGYRSVGSVPNSDHPKGLATDFMTLSRTKGDATAQYLIDNYQRLGVTYVIYWRKIWNPQQGWHDYDGPNPHFDHVHASYSGKPDPSKPSQGDNTGNPLNPANWPVVKQIEGFSGALTSRETWIRVGTYALGAFLIVIALVIIFRKPISKAAETGAKVVL